MPTESERRFLIPIAWFDSQIDVLHARFYEVQQGYLNLDPDRTVRVRLLNDPQNVWVKSQQAYITVKGRKDNSGSGLEFEYDVPYEDARKMLTWLCVGHTVSKTRYVINVYDHTVEMDVFHGDNEGLIIAEVEDRPEVFVAPDVWVEVTDQPGTFSNASLAQHPFSKSGGTPLLDGKKR